MEAGLPSTRSLRSGRLRGTVVDENYAAAPAGSVGFDRIAALISTSFRSSLIEFFTGSILSQFQFARSQRSTHRTLLRSVCLY